MTCVKCNSKENQTQNEVRLEIVIDVRHEKTDLKVFVVVIPKEGPFWYDTDFLEFESFDFIDHIL